MSGVGDPERHLHHLTGARCLCSFWIVCGHFAPVLTPTAFGAPRHRGNVAVNFFIILSGFLTHWAYASRILEGPHQLYRFYIRRIGRVVLTTWLAMALGLVVVVIQLRGGFPSLRHLVSCALFLEPWRDPCDWCPNGQTWTVAALLPSWLLYPLTSRAIAAAEHGGGWVGLVALAIALWAASFGPQLALFLRQGHWLSNMQGTWTEVWPPSQMPDFAVGAVTAALALRHSADARDSSSGCCPVSGSGGGGLSARGVLADACAGAVAIAVLAAPTSGPRVGWEPLFNHGLAPFLAAFLYGSSASHGAGTVAKLLRHDALVGLGAYSFEVYLFQWPVHEIFVALGDITGSFRMRNAAGTHNTNPTGFMGFFVALWFTAGLYAEYVEVHLVCWLRRISAEPQLKSAQAEMLIAASYAKAPLAPTLLAAAAASTEDPQAQDTACCSSA